MTALFEFVPRALQPKPETIALLEQVRGNGHDVYCLSNRPLFAIEYIKRHPFWRLFAGAVVSSRCGLVKPEPGIFLHLLATYSLAPEQTFFVDDVQNNVDAARRLGMRGVVYRDAAQCRAALAAAGFLAAG